MEDLRKLLPYLKKYRARLIFTVLLGVLLAPLAPALAKLAQYIIDEITKNRNREVLMYAPVGLIGLYFVAGCIRFFHMYWLRYTGDCVAADLRNDLEKKFTDLSMDYYSENTSGNLISRTLSDVNWVQLGLGLFSDIVREPIALVATLGFLIYTNWRLTLALAFAVPVLVLASKSLGRSVRKYSLLMQESNEQLTNSLKETLDGMRIIKAFSLEKAMLARFKKATDFFLYTRRKILSREELASPLFEFLAAIVCAGFLFYAGTQMINNHMTTGEFLAFIFALGALQQPIKKLQDAHVRLQHTVASSRRVFEILDTPISVKDPGQEGRVAKSLPTQWEKIEFRDVYFSYKAREVLNGLSLTVARGEMLALVGPSGAGKSTLVNLLPRFYDVSAGGIWLGDVNIRDLNLKDLRSQIALVSQDVFLFNDTIKSNVIGSLPFDSDKFEKALIASHSDQFINRLELGVETRVGDRGLNLSGGERQRISIARAIYKNAPILILDEATSNLDSKSESLVQNALDQLMQGRTSFVIAHRLSTIKQANRIIVLSDGKIVEQGSHTELLKQNSSYQKMYTMQV